MVVAELALALMAVVEKRIDANVIPSTKWLAEGAKAKVSHVVDDIHKAIELKMIPDDRWLTG